MSLLRDNMTILFRGQRYRCGTKPGGSGRSRAGVSPFCGGDAEKILFRPDSD